MKRRILSLILALAMVLSLGLSAFADGGETQADIVDAAFALAAGESLADKTLTGTVSSIATPYSATNQNVTVNIHVLDGSGAERAIQCYRIKGDDAATVGVGDVITVTGTITNYNGLIEFKANSTFVTVSKATGDYAIKTFAGYASGDVALLVRQGEKTTVSEVTGGKDYNAYTLIVCDGEGTVTDLDLRGPGRPAGVKGDYVIPEGGFIVAINRDVSDYPTYVGSVEGTEQFMADGVKAGDTVVLYGVDLEALVDTAAQTALEGASFSVVPAFVEPETQADILAAAFALDPGTALAGGPYTLTGTVTKKTDNKTQVNFTVGDKDVLCYQMASEDYAAVAVGDIISVTGKLKNYNGVVEFDTGCTAAVIHAAEKVDLPEGAIAIDSAQGWRGDICVIYVPLTTGENTLGTVTGVTTGKVQDCTWWNAIIVDAEGKVVKKIGMTDKTNEEIPAGGYILAAHGSSPALAVLASIESGSTITLYNCDLAAFATLGVGIDLTQAAFTITEPVVERPASYQKSYELTTASGTLSYWNAEKCQDDGTLLTDGKKGSLIGDQTGYNVAISGLSLENPAILTIDLGEAKWVNKFITYNSANTGWGIAGANAVKVSYSLDGTTFKSAGEVTGIGTIYEGTGSGWTCYEHSLELANAVSARYVKFEITSGGNNKFLWIEEAEVWEGEEPVIPVLDASLWNVFDADSAVYVDGVNAGKFQGNDENAACGNAYSYVYAYDKENVYVAVQTNYAGIGAADSYGNGVGTNLRLWFRTNDEAVVYTHFVDISYDGDAEPTISAKKNGSLTANSGATAIATEGVVAEAVAGENTLFMQVKIPFTVIEATDDFGLFVTLANGKSGDIVNNCIIHPYDANCTFDKEGMDPTKNNTYFPYTSWNSEAIIVDVPGPLFVWDENAWVDAVIGENAGYQNADYAPSNEADPSTVLSPKFQYRVEDGYLYAAALYNLPLTKGTGNGNSTFFRVWVKTDIAQTSYRYFYEVYVKTDDTLGFRAADNIVGTYDGLNKPTNNAASEYVYNMVETDAGVLAEIRIPLEEIGATDYLAAYLTASIEKVTGGAVNNQCVYFPALGEVDGAIKHITSGTWTEENNNIGLILIEPVEPITENILDLEELKIIDVITFTADDPSIGTVRVYGSVDGEEYYDLNAGGAAKVNADTGVASVALTTQGYIQVRYIKVEGTDVHGTITATFKAADEGAFIAPPAGPYDFGLKEESAYCIVMLENRVVDINAVKGDDYVVAPKNNQLIITQKVANGVYKIIANSVNAWPDQGHPELITAGIEGLNIDENGIITLADDQFAFVIVSSGSIKTAGDEQTAPAKRIDRGLGVNGYLRVDGDKLTLHVNEPEAVEEPAADPDNYLWLLGTGTDDPGINFKVPGELLAEGEITIKALVKFSEDCTGSVYLNCYAYAEDKFNDWDYLMNFIDYATSANTVLGQWTEVEFTYNPSIGTYGKQAGNNQVPAMLSMGMGFWQATGTVSVANIRIEQNGETIWSLDFAEGLDLSKACEDGYYGISDDNKDVRWGVVGAKEPEVPVVEPYEATVIVKDNAILTDGNTGFDGAWGTVGTGDVLLVSNAECKTAPMVVTIIDELDDVKAIKKVSLDLYHDANVMIGYPEGKATVYVSADGVDYTLVGEFDLVAAEVALGSHGTVSSAFEFDATEAKFVKIVLNAGSNAAVLGDSPADGKVNWEFISIAEIAVEGEEESEPVQPETLETVPEDAIVIDYAGYKHAGVVSILAGDGQTVAELTARGNNGTAKDLNYAYNILVDADNIVIATDYALGVACTFEVPEGGYIISYNGNKAGYVVMSDIAVGAIIYVGNVNLSAVRTLEGNVELESAFFTYENPSVERPISFEKPYTVAKAEGAATYWSNASISLEDDGAILTDGKKGSLDGASHSYVALNGLGGAAGVITVDLGEAAYVDTFITYTAQNTGWGVPQAKYIVVSYSLDGETYTQAGVIEGDGEIYAGTGSGWTSYVHALALEKAVEARYVKFEVTTWAAFLWIEEVEVWEGEEPVSTETSIDGEFHDSIWDDAVWTEYDGYNVGTWQQYQKKGTYTYKTALVEDDEYIYFAGIVDTTGVTQIRTWFRTNPEAALYTHFIDIFPDKDSYIKKNQSLTDNSGAIIDGAYLEFKLLEADGKTYVEYKAKKSDLEIDGDYEFIPQASVDGFSNLLGAEIVHGNFEFGGKTMTYFPWVHWPALPEEDYVGLIPVTNHWIFSDIPYNGEVGVISKAHYERQEDGSLRFVVGGTAYWPCVTYYYEEAKVYNVERGTLNYKFTTDRCNTNITFIFEDAEGVVYSFPLANTALGLGEGQYDKGSGDIRPGTYEGTIALSDLVAAKALLGGTEFPEADATELKFTGITIYACGITDPAGGVYIDDLSVELEPLPEVTENILDLGEIVTITGVTFTPKYASELTSVEILGSADGVNYYRLNSEAAVAVNDGVASLNLAMAGGNYRAFVNVRYIKVVGAPNVEGDFEVIEAEEADLEKGLEPQGPYTLTGLNEKGYGIVVWTAEDVPEGFGLNEKGVYTNNGKALNLNSCMITIAEKVGNGVYKILWNDSNGWSAATGAAHLNTPEGVEGVDYRDEKIYLGNNQIAMLIMSSGGYNTAGDGEFSSAKWILRGVISGGFLKFENDTVGIYIEQPEAVPVPEPETYLWLIGTGEDDPNINFKVPGSVLAEGDITIKALVRFGEDCVANGGLVYLNCYSYAQDEYNNWNYLMNFIDYARNADYTPGEWVEVEYTYDPAVGSYGSYGGQYNAPEMLSLGVGFYLATGTISVAYIQVEQEGEVVWSVDFANGVDFDITCEGGVSNMTDDNKNIRWGVAGIDEPEPELTELDVADFDGDGEITSDDAIYLLRNTLFGDKYPINVKAPFYGDEDPTSDDAIYLLRYTLFPDRYPILANE